MRTAKPLVAAIAATLTLWCAGAPLADDTEIFEATPVNGTAARPNILLIIDTSGSMVDNSVTQAMDYDPVTSYSGTCTNDRIYWKQGNNSFNCRDQSDQYIDANALVCSAASLQVATIGSYVVANTAQWRAGSNKRWEQLRTNQHSSSNPVECAADGALFHGLVDNDRKLPANGSSGPFTTNSAQAVSLAGQNTYTFYSGNYLNYLANVGNDNQVTLTRLAVVQSVARKFLDSLSGVNVGLMRFQNKDSDDGGAQGGFVIHEFAPIETARDDLKKLITDLNGNSYTPLSETLYEASRYWRGRTPTYGNNSTAGQYSYSVDASRVAAGGAYKSPLTNSCSTNFNVFLTDGDPTQDKDADSKIEGLAGMVGTDGTAGTCSDNGGDGSASGQDRGDGRCLDDIAKYMFDKDLLDDPAIPDATDPKNNVRTYTIGFGSGIVDTSILGSTAKFGGGKAYVATDGITLNEAFQDITRDVVDTNVSFSAPTVAVNAFNRTQNLNDLFMTVFAPSDQYHWAGNLKKYRLLANGTIKDSSTPAKDAVSGTTGFFATGTRSYWSTVDDGPDVELGGAAHRLPVPASRKVYTDLSTGALKATGNLVETTNSGITRALVGLPAAAINAELAAQIKWIRGADVDDGDKDSDFDEARFEMGDPLHARPVSIIYRGTVAAPVGVIYVATNDGYLHAINPANGDELWSYMPSELMARSVDLRENDVSQVKRYALDANIRAFKLDRNGDGIVDGNGTNATDDRVLLFFGQGRGGSNYYALDVTDEANPKLLWKHGGITGDNAFVGLGQSWSTPVVTRVNVSGATQNADKLVLIFGGGYDITQDNVGYNTDDTGNRLFMVDAINGNVLWHAGPTNTTGLGHDSTANFFHPKLTTSIPADIRVIDMTGDGFADRMYTADTGGRVWRFDINNGKSAGTGNGSAPFGSTGTTALVTGGPLASLGFADAAGTSPADARKFYVAPDASLVTTTSNNTFVNLAIGSGMRGSPKNTQVSDRLYSLRDHSPFAALSQAQYNALTVINDAAVQNITTTLSPTLADLGTGWKIVLGTGEKVLAEARTFQGAILFSTYDADAGTVTNTGGCTQSSGRNGLFIVKTLNGDPFANRDSNATITVEDRRGDLAQQGLAPEAVIIFPSPDDPTTCQGAQCSPPPVCLVGLENCGVSFTDAPIKTFWSQRDVD